MSILMSRRRAVQTAKNKPIFKWEATPANSPKKRGRKKSGTQS